MSQICWRTPVAHHPTEDRPPTRTADPAHCAVTTFSTASRAHLRRAGRACGAPLTPETSASPAGLTARARPKARPETRGEPLRLSEGWTGPSQLRVKP